MGQNCEKFLPMCLESVKDADTIVFCDGGSDDNTYSILNDKSWLIPDDWRISGGSERFIGSTKRDILYQEYNQEDKAMNGKQRNFYLNHLKEKYPNDWALILDADEVVEDLSKIKEFIQEAQPGLYHVKMRHFIGDLSKEDNTNSEHFGLCRLFKISEAGSYSLVEHPVLQAGKDTQGGYYRGTTIWHLGYINGIFDINKKYQNHLKKSNMHTPEYLKGWKYSHILGAYPTKLVNVLEIPEVILNNFGIDKDEFYFQNRGLNVNNFLMVRDWFAYFNPMSVIDLGCGLGNYGFVFNKFYGSKYKGVELSEFAVKQNPYKLDLIKGNIIDYKDANKYELVLCLDILEHLTESELDKTLENIQYLGYNYLFSIPFIGDPNLMADNTHKIHQTKDWWLQKLNHFFEIREVPETWHFSNQLLIGIKK